MGPEELAGTAISCYLYPRQLGTLGIVPKEKGPYSARAGELAT